MFDQRAYLLFKKITHHPTVTKSEVLRKLELSERQFQYDLEKMNDALARLEMPEVTVDNHLFVIDPQLSEAINSGLIREKMPHNFIIADDARPLLLYLYTFIRQEPISNYHYQLLLGVSKNTALTDVRRIRERCTEWDIELLYTRVKGYHLKGTELDKRRFASFSIGTLLAETLGKETLILALRKWGLDECLVKTKQIIQDFTSEQEIALVRSRKREMIFQLTFVRARNKSDLLLFKSYEQQLIESQRLFKQGTALAMRLFGDNALLEKYYVTIQLLITQQEVAPEENPLLLDLAEQIIDSFEKVTLLPLPDKSFLHKSLYNHLVPAFFRIAYGIPLVNPLTARIKLEYQELFQFVKSALAPLSMWTGREINEDEVAFFTLHFGSYFKAKPKPESKPLRAIIACMNGISSSLMLKAQLTEMYPSLHLSSVHSLDEIPAIPTEDYDLIFSTVDVASSKPVYTVKPFLNQVEKNYLFQAVAADFPHIDQQTVPIDELMAVIGKYADIKDSEQLFSELVNLVYLQKNDKRRHSPMLSELLTADMIQFTEESLTWKDAIEEAARPLLATGKIEASYVEAMINNVEELGPYIHVGKGVAIPHARPEAGVKEIGMSLLRTKAPVLLLDDAAHEIDLFICIAAIDNEVHLKALAHLTRILSDDDKLQQIKDATTAEEIIDIIKKGEM